MHVTVCPCGLFSFQDGLGETSQGSRGGDVQMSCFRWFAVVIGQSFGLSAPLWVTFLCFLLGLTSIKTSCFSPSFEVVVATHLLPFSRGGGRRLLGCTRSLFWGFVHFCKVFHLLPSFEVVVATHLSPLSRGGGRRLLVYPFPSLGFVHFCYRCHSLFFFAFVKQTLTSNVNFHSIN